jgi:outer membrane protein OmpA-like peptidoglycan-associated protein
MTSRLHSPDRHRRIRLRIGLAVLAAALGGCALNTGTVVLLPEQDNHKESHKTAVAVRQGDVEVVLDQPYAAARQTRSGPQPYTSNPQEVAEFFGAALAAQPIRPKAYTLYFVEGTDDLTADSQQILDSVLSEIARYPVPDVVVIGHTDTVGSDRDNDALALRRAETMRKALVERNIAPENVTAAGRGKRELFKSTPDGVAEPLNRRVEILVR